VLAYNPPASVPSSNYASNSPRLVFPGPSYALAKIVVRQNDVGEWTLHAAKDFTFGERVYEFWRSDWPFGGRDSIVMVASTKLNEFDLPEGTGINRNPKECAAKEDRSGHCQFSGFDLLVSHSCVPNLTYNDLHEDEDDEWQGAYATRTIKSGEELTTDFNSVLWDRSSSSGANACDCGTSNCVGTKAGFKVTSTTCTVRASFCGRRSSSQYIYPTYGRENLTNYIPYLGAFFTMHACSFLLQRLRKNASS